MKRAQAQAKKKKIYSVHPGLKMVASWEANLGKKTGRTIEEWKKLIDKSAPKDETLCIGWLKEKYKLGTNTAKFLSEFAFGKGLEHRDAKKYLESADVWVAEMYSGPKESLRPIYDKLLKLGFSLGKDVTATPCKTIVPLRRKYVIAQIKPSTNTRIDLGLALGKTKATGRLVATGGFAKGDRITHRIPIVKLADIDREVMKWLQMAYEMDK